MSHKSPTPTCRPAATRSGGGRARDGARVAVLLVLTAATGAGLLLFASGFFPVKPFIPGYSPASNLPVHTRLVFVLVDALRSDFAFGPSSNMPFVASLIASGHGLPFTAIAQPPTVTLPRLKALTTGSNPTFLDAMLNIAEDSDSAVLEHVDSWVRQLAVGDREDSRGEGNGRKIAFVGDDTWLRLFPKEWFVWTEGVTSFMVSDTSTVDTNVTRHLDALLSGDSSTGSSAPTEWDALILHYLGMDHVGHLGGPNSPLMAPKQREMDDVVERLFTSLEAKDAEDGGSSLLVLVGDHGMSETGNHGGSTEGETSAALLFASPSSPRAPPPSSEPASNGPYLLHQVVNQIDLVPTLSVLMGLGIPRNSMGKLIEPVLEHWYPGSLEGASNLLKTNADQIGAVLTATDASATLALRCEAALVPPSQCTSFFELTSSSHFSKFIDLVQDRLLSTFGDHDLVSMSLGLSILFLTAISLAVLARPYVDSNQALVVGGAFAMFLGSRFATTFLEEEHEIWFFFTATAIGLLAIRKDLPKGARLRLVVAGVAVRLMRAWSFNGQKATTNTSLSLSLSASPTTLSFLAILTLTLFAYVSFSNLVRIAQSLQRGQAPTKLLGRAASFAVLLTLVLLHSTVVVAAHLNKMGMGGGLVKVLGELEVGTPVAIARVGFALGGLTLVVARIIEWQDATMRHQLDELKLATFVTLLASIARTANVPLFLLLWSQYRILSHLPLPPLLFTSLIIAFQRTSYFAFGGSNSLATVDLSQAYNGISTYSLPLVSLLTFLSNFAGPVFWSLATPSLLHHSQRSSTRTSHFYLSNTMHVWSLLILAISATHFRHHLFTFTVFSPALLFEGVWNTWMHLGGDVGIAFLME